jgi:hypothetical protein
LGGGGRGACHGALVQDGQGAARVLAPDSRQRSHLPRDKGRREEREKESNHSLKLVMQSLQTLMNDCFLLSQSLIFVV